MAARRPDRSGTIQRRSCSSLDNGLAPTTQTGGLEADIHVQRSRLSVVMNEAEAEDAQVKSVNRVEDEMAHAPSSSSEPEVMQNTNHNNQSSKSDSMQRVRVRRVRRWRIIPEKEKLLVPKVFFLCSVMMSSSVVSGFNVDVNSRVVHSGPGRSCDRECMFGFAVAQHRERGVPW